MRQMHQMHAQIDDMKLAMQNKLVAKVIREISSFFIKMQLMDFRF